MHINRRQQRRREARARTRKLGVLHHSGLNRAQRRQEAAVLRLKPQADRVERAEDAHDLRKAQIQARVARKQGAAHTRAIARREAITGKPSMLTRARIRMQAMIQTRQEEKRRRSAAHARKVARLQTTQ